MITAERLREALDYDPATGVFTWKNSTGRKLQGTAAGTPRGGYVQIGLDRRVYYAHRLAWLYVHGVWPVAIDHENEVKSDNRLVNLRHDPFRQNMHNQSKPQRNNTTGYRGVCHKYPGSFTAEIRINGVPRYLGTYRTAEEAHEAYVKAKQELHPFWVRKECPSQT